MKILLLSSIYPEPMEYGIPDDTAAIHYFAKEFVKLGHEVVVCHLYSNPISRIRHYPLKYGIKENWKDNVRIIFSELQILIPHRFSASKVQQIIAARRNKEYLKKINFQPDMIFVHFPSTFPWFCKTMIGEQYACCVLHNTDLVEMEKAMSTNNQILLELIRNTFAKIGFRSKRLYERGMAIGVGDVDSPIINSGIPSGLIRRKTEILQKKISHNKPLNLIFVGKLVEQKRIHVLLKALKICHCEYFLKIVGEGPYRNDLEKMARELGIEENVQFLGKLPRDEVAKEMFNSDMFVMVSKHETLGLVYIEAMAAGCVTVGTKGEGIDGIIESGKNGFLVTPDNEIELAKIIDYVWACDGSQIDKIRLGGYVVASHMTDEVVAVEYINKMTGEYNRRVM